MKYMDCPKCGKTLIDLLPGQTDDSGEVEGMFWCDDCDAGYIATNEGVIGA